MLWGSGSFLSLFQQALSDTTLEVKERPASLLAGCVEILVPHLASVDTLEWGEGMGKGTLLLLV